MQQHAIRLPLEFDAARLATDLATTLEYGTVRQFGGYHDGSWTGLSLRSEGGQALTTRTGIAPTGEPFADSPVLEHTPYFREVLATIPRPHRVVRLLHLPAGARIEPHVDPPLTFQHGILRLHIPIVTHPDVELVIGGVRCNWLPGELWWGNFSLLHHVYNRSTINRVHLVMDVEITPSILTLFPPDFVAVQEGRGIAYHQDAIQMAPSELQKFECILQVPPDVLPEASFGAGGAVGLRVLDGQLTIVPLTAEEGAASGLKLEPVGKAEFAIVGWSHGVTLRLSLAGGNVAGAMLVIRGLSKQYLSPEADDNPRLACNEIPLDVIGASPTLRAETTRA